MASVNKMNKIKHLKHAVLTLHSPYSVEIKAGIKTTAEQVRILRVGALTMCTCEE